MRSLHKLHPSLRRIGLKIRIGSENVNDDLLALDRITVSKNDLITLIDNMRSLSKQWRSSIGKHGELVFYIDAC